MSVDREIEVYAAILDAATNAARRDVKRILHDEKWLGLSGAEGVNEALRRIEKHPRRQEIVARSRELKAQRPVDLFLLARSPETGKTFVVYRGTMFAMIGEINPDTRQVVHIDWIKRPTAEKEADILRKAEQWLSSQNVSD